MNVPTEIRDRYAAGEREIRVSPQTYQDYCDGLMVLIRYELSAAVDHAASPREWVWYKDAKVCVC